MPFMSRSWHPLLEGSAAAQAEQALREIATSLTLPEHAFRTGREASVAGGVAGQALFYSYLHLHTSDPAAADRAVELLDRAAEELAGTPMPPSLYSGFP